MIQTRENKDTKYLVPTNKIYFITILTGPLMQMELIGLAQEF